MQIHNYWCSLLIVKKVWYFLSGWCNTWRKDYISISLFDRSWMHLVAFTSGTPVALTVLFVSLNSRGYVKSKSVPFRTVLGRTEIKMSVKTHNKLSALMNLTSSVDNQKHFWLSHPPLLPYYPSRSKKYRFETSLQRGKIFAKLVNLHPGMFKIF